MKFKFETRPAGKLHPRGDELSVMINTPLPSHMPHLHTKYAGHPLTGHLRLRRNGHGMQLIFLTEINLKLCVDSKMKMGLEIMGKPPSILGVMIDAGFSWSG